MSDDPLMTPKEVAELFRVTPYTVRVWLKDGDLVGIRFNNQWRIRKSEVAKFAERNFG